MGQGGNEQEKTSRAEEGGQETVCTKKTPPGSRSGQSAGFPKPYLRGRSNAGAHSVGNRGIFITKDIPDLRRHHQKEEASLSHPHLQKKKGSLLGFRWRKRGRHVGVIRSGGKKIGVLCRSGMKGGDSFTNSDNPLGGGRGCNHWGLAPLGEIGRRSLLSDATFGGVFQPQQRRRGGVQNQRASAHKQKPPAGYQSHTTRPHSRKGEAHQRPYPTFGAKNSLKIVAWSTTRSSNPLI